MFNPCSYHQPSHQPSELLGHSVQTKQLLLGCWCVVRHVEWFVEVDSFTDVYRIHKNKTRIFAWMVDF